MLIKYQSKHRDICAEIYYRLFTSPEWGHDWLTIENVVRYLQDIQNTPNFVGYVFFRNDKLVGCCLGYIDDYFATKTYNIKEIFVEPQLQKAGIGSRMLKAVELDLKGQDVSAVSLFTSKQIPAYKFYTKNEYVEGENTVHFVKII
jgi:ribosomal protein S18 acetylase RimI-like enzyme